PQLAAHLRDQFDVHRALRSGLTAPEDASRRGLTPGRPAAAPPPAPALPPGYELLGELGRGGMGVGYRARQVALNRLVALKMIRYGASADARELARFQVEAEAVARLQHPNIVQIHEVGEHQGQPYLVLEYVGGGTLAAKVAGTPQPSRHAAGL